MIIFLGGGRLGNQIFQYVFIKSIAKTDEKIIVCGFEELSDVFEIKDIINISRKNRLVRGIIFRIVSPILKLLCSLRLLTKIEVDYNDPPEFKNSFPRRENNTYTETRGLLRSVRFINTGYFQSESFFKREIANKLVIKTKYSETAEAFLKVIPEDAHKVFVHVRRGDYKEFTIFGKSTLLPVSYYKNQIDYFVKKYEKTFFIFLSDEPEFIEREFGYIQTKKLAVNNKPGTDIAIMSKCSSAILSTSSFGWWGAYLIKNKGIIFAPKYWLGFNSKIEFPSGGFPQYATSVEP